MARPQVRDISSPEIIQGVAAPVSTYVRPADAPKSQLHELAEGLSSFDQGLGSFMAQRKQESDEADKAKAITDFHRFNQEGYADAVRDGLIPPTASKSYVEWYKRQTGNLAGLKLSDKFALDYQQWGGKDSADSASFGTFLSGWMKNNVGKEQDPYVLEGLAPHLERLSTGGYDAFNRDRAASLKSKAEATSGALLTDTISRTQDAAKAEGSVDYEGLWGGLMAQRQEAISKGERSEDFDKLIVDSVILQAEESGSKDILKILDKTMPGQSLSLASNPEFREKRLRAINRINSQQASQSTELAQTREKLDKQNHEARLAEATAAIMNGEDVPEETIKVLSRRDGEIRYKLAKMKKEKEDLDVEEDPAALMHVYQEIDSGSGKNFVLQMRDKGVIKNPATFLKAMDRVESIRKAAEDGGVFTSPTYKDTVKLITDLTGTAPTVPFGPKGLSDEGLEALYDYRNMLLDWDMKNPQSSLMEKEKAAREMGEIIRSRIYVDTTSGSTTKQAYQSDADKAKAEAAAKPAPGAQPTAAAPGTSTANQPAQSEGGYFPEAIRNMWDWFNEDSHPEPQGNAAPVAPQPLASMSPKFQKTVQDFAQKKGISVDEAYNLVTTRAAKVQTDKGPMASFNPLNIVRNATEGFRDNLQQFEQGLGANTEGRPASVAPSGPGFNPLGLVQTATSNFRDGITSFEQGMGAPSNGVAANDAGSVSPETRSKLTALLQDPPKVQRLTASNVPVAPLLSLIGNTEGTDKRNGYNESLGYGILTGGDRNLVGMTLGEIDKLQTDMLRSPNNKWNSSALGRYQIVRTTLRTLKQEMGLSDDLKFTPELQDRMAMQLLERRGLSAWQAGRMSDEQFMNGLSAEWASLPRSNGRGTYSGQRVGTSTEGVRGALDQIRGTGGTEVASLDPSVGLPDSDPYANIPDTDGNGSKGQREKFREWNPDPVGNHETNLQSIQPELADVVRRAEALSGTKFVVGSGKRTPEMQKKAVEWGWSKTEESDHLDGSSVDLWPLDDKGAVKFDPARQQEIVMAMKLAAKELGVKLDIGAEWKSFKDKPHFGIKK